MGGVIKGSFQKHLKQGVGKGKSCSWEGGGFEGVTTPAPPENFNHTRATSASYSVKLCNLFIKLVFLLRFQK